MKTTFDYLRQTRQNILKTLVNQAGKEHMIPKGFKNSLYWNAAHCLVTQQLLCYKLSGEEVKVDDEIIEAYRKGAAPTDSLPDVLEVAKVKELLITSVDQLEEDYNNGLFKKYSPYTTSYGVTLNSIEDAINFNNIHEGLHFGYMMAMVR